LRAAIAAAAAAASACDFGVVNDSAGVADSAPKTRGGTSGACDARVEAVPESGGV
jgi:hypothetical protein